MNNISVLVSGVGINDADYTVTINETVSGRKTGVGLPDLFDMEACYRALLQQGVPEEMSDIRGL